MPSLLISVLLFYCKSGKIRDVEIDNTKFISEYNKERSNSKYPHSLCIIFDGAMHNKKITIYSDTKEVLYSGVVNIDNSAVPKIIFSTNEDSERYLQIDNKLYILKNSIYAYYRYLVCKESLLGMTLMHTNEYNMPFAELIKLPDIVDI
jgi:hypothetical protein